MKLASEPQSDGVDQVLLYRVRAALRQKRYTLLRSVIVTVDNGVVMVHGRVPTFYLRQIAIECIKSVAGVTRVLDRIDVVPGDRLGKERRRAVRLPQDRSHATVAKVLDHAADEPRAAVRQLPDPPVCVTVRQQQQHMCPSRGPGLSRTAINRQQRLVVDRRKLNTAFHGLASVEK